MAHIHEKIDFTASICIVYKDKVLLHRHKKLDIWLPPGGHVELDEDPNEAAIREAKEETGLDVELVGSQTSFDTPSSARDLIMPRFLNRHFFDETRTHEHVNMCFFARAKTHNAQPGEGEGAVRWFTKAELESGEFDIIPDVLAHARAALDELAQ